jgi:hypothetical protein
MEIILAIVVAVAVVFFGALISAGNERQRKAIDNLREQLTLWAIHDLRIKSASLARVVQIDNPLRWFNKVATKVCGYDVNLQVIESIENPRALVCNDKDTRRKIIFTPFSPSEIRSMRRTRINRLSQYADRNPLLTLPRDVNAIECSILNNGILFDIELPLAWKGLTKQGVEQMESIWMYVISV